MLKGGCQGWAVTVRAQLADWNFSAPPMRKAWHLHPLILTRRVWGSSGQWVVTGLAGRAVTEAAEWERMTQHQGDGDDLEAMAGWQGDDTVMMRSARETAMAERRGRWR